MTKDGIEEIESKDFELFDPELEAIVKGTKDVAVTDGESKVYLQNVDLKPNKNSQNNTILQSISKPKSEVEKTVQDILSRKQKNSMQKNITLSVFDKKTFGFVEETFKDEINSEKLIDIMVNNYDINELRKSLKKILMEYYKVEEEKPKEY